MAIDFSRLDISLDKFNAESSGTYNIGHLKLSSDGTSVYRTNNHKTFTLFNNTKISSEEALAVKFAFCKALLTQRPSQGLLFSEGVALDPNDSTSKLFFGGEMGGGSIKHAYALSFAKDGSLNISCRATQENFSMMMLFGGTADGEGTVPVMPGKGSKVDATMSLKIDTAELDRLAGIDFSKFDDKGLSEKYADKNLQHRYSDRTLLGNDFMLDDSKITCTSTYKLTIN